MFAVLVCGVTCFWAVYAPRIPQMSYWVMYYGVFLLLNLALFGFKLKFQFCRALAVSLWALFVMGAFWELPIILYDVFGFLFLPFLKHFNTWVGPFTLSQWVFSHVNRAYVLAVLILFVELVKIRRTRLNMLLISVGLTLNMIILLFRFGSYSLIVETIAHIIGYAFFTLAVLDGLPNNPRTKKTCPKCGSLIISCFQRDRPRLDICVKCDFEGVVS